MNTRKFRLLALSLTSLAAGGVGSGSSEAATKTGKTSGANTQLAADMVSAHNEARASAKPAPKPALPPLTWSEDAAKVARAWASPCRFEHNPNRGKHGENLAAAAPPGSKTNKGAVKDWAAEVADYTYASNKCAPGKMCGHYTQVVWRNTTQVGCATVTCTKNSPFGAQFPKWQLWVCNYAPPGNVVGQKPY
ncbi:serine protease [Archangium violaceum]|uniref:CAP domain-containing protein n=1 Tax=Archangium violaceum TaxID=83451 RepID=UPI001951F6C4|nr:CAP domain-containing protein [Archangium violaceum]QRN98198.1 serine protease [Archangium violaceum]